MIVADTSEQLGVMKVQDALKKAQSLGLDLVEVAATANPPVCRIVDFGKYRYQLAKMEKASKSVQTKLKEVKFRVKIAEHDYETKVRRAEEFLDKGNKVKIQLQFRGRENAHKDLGDLLMLKVRADLATMAQCEMEPKHIGRAINMTLSPLPAAKRKRKFAPMTDEELLAEEEEHEQDDDDEVADEE